MTDPLNNEFDVDDADAVEVPVSDAWRDMMETQLFLREDPYEWGVSGTVRHATHQLEVYVESEVDECESHEGDILPANLLRFMAGRGWHVTRLGLGQQPNGHKWLPVAEFSRGSEVFDSLIRHDIPVEPAGHNWPSLYDALTDETP